MNCDDAIQCARRQSAALSEGRGLIRVGVRLNVTVGRNQLAPDIGVMVHSGKLQHQALAVQVRPARCAIDCTGLAHVLRAVLAYLI